MLCYRWFVADVLKWLLQALQWKCINKMLMSDREQMNDVFSSTNLYRLKELENCLWESGESVNACRIASMWAEFYRNCCCCCAAVCNEEWCVLRWSTLNIRCWWWWWWRAQTTNGNTKRRRVNGIDDGRLSVKCFGSSSFTVQRC